MHPLLLLRQRREFFHLIRTLSPIKNLTRRFFLNWLLRWETAKNRRRGQIIFMQASLALD
jgi:hypothetical protein